MVELLIGAKRELTTWTDHRFVQQPDALRANDYQEMSEKPFTFLDKLANAYRPRTSPAGA